MTCNRNYLKASKTKTLEELYDFIIKNVDAENPMTFNTNMEIKQFDEVRLMNFVMEKRYRRISGSVNLFIEFLEYHAEQYVTIISYVDNVLFDLGSMKHFSNLLIVALKELGFEEV